MQHVTIVGAGLAGTLLSLYLARRGYQVDVFESRPDLRHTDLGVGRSINLALSCRGARALNEIGLMGAVEKIMVPMRARAIHEKNRPVHYQAFGRHQEEYINAIMRSQLNALLLDQTAHYPEITIRFDTKLQSVDFNRKELVFQLEDNSVQLVPYQRLIAADGAVSAVRGALQKAGHLDYSRKLLPHGYKELSISRKHDRGCIREHLHLWPRDSFMLLGNPNCDDSITGSLFMANKGINSFETLHSERKVTDFFKRAFPDIYPAIPNLAGEFFTNPTGNLGTVSCSSWHYRDNCLLIGDAAHGIVPFFGQGMNSAFEDCFVLDQLLDKYDEQWQLVMPAFEEARKPNTNAIAQMSMDNYSEIQSGICDIKFNLKKQLEHVLMRQYPDTYISKHVLVMFSNTPYAKAQSCGKLQQDLLDSITENVADIEEVDWQKTDGLMKQYDKKMTHLMG